MKYMRENTEDTYGIKELQDKILEIAVCVDEFCRKYDINYCLMGGSALGAKRHGGFIPWDDDLDIFMTPDNYEKFRDCFEKYGDKGKFYLQEMGKRKNGKVSMAKVRMNGTVLFEELTKDWDIHKGIYIDIFILHTCPNNRILRLWQYFWAKCVVIKGLSMRDYNGQTGFLQFVVNFSKILPQKLMLDFALKQVYRFRNKETDCYCNFLGRAVFKSGIYKRTWFDNAEYVPFETVELKAPSPLHEFLSARFGDYMVLPGAESIKRAQHAAEWHTDVESDDCVNRQYKDEWRCI